MMAQILDRLDRWQTWATALPLAGRFTLACRLLLAAAFLPTGLVKLLGQRFTVLGVESPVGLFFEAMYQSGAYWRFLGLAQLTAGLLLLVPATAFYGALLFLPIIVNIAIITTAIDFKGTIVVTWLMCLANCWLLAWDWPRWRPLLVASTPRPLLAGSSRVERVAWLVAGTAGIGVLFATRIRLPYAALPALLAIGAAAAIIGAVSALRTLRMARGTRAAE